jgi:adenylate kinase
MILFFGPPGSGKSVQGQLLVEKNGWRWLSTGQLFRQSTNPAVIKRLADGGLIDDDTTNELVDEELGKLEASSSSTQVIFDGYPRNLQQARWLQTRLADHDQQVDCVIVFEVPEEELLQRLSGRGRPEDEADVVEKRLAIYHDNTAPVLDFYQQQTTVPFNAIDGTGSVEEVHNRIQQALAACKLV